MPPSKQRHKRKEKVQSQNVAIGKTGKSGISKSIASSDASSIISLPIPLQQLVLNISKASLLFPVQAADQGSQTSLTEKVQTIKAHLYRRDFAKAFSEADEDALRAYALRWSAGRALAYATIFWGMKDVLFGKTRTDVLCIGGGAGAEILALGAVWRELCAEKGLLDRFSELSVHSGGAEEKRGDGTTPQDTPELCVTAVDIADWSSVVDRLVAGMTSLSVPSKNTCQPPLLPVVNGNHPKKHFTVQFHKRDVLELSDSHIRTLAYPASSCDEMSDRTALVTLMFTLNELFSTSMSKTVSFLLRLTDILEPGATLLIVDSPGSYSTLSIGSTSKASQAAPHTSKMEGKPQREYPMRFLLEHTLLSVAAEKWTCVLSDDSRWFRREKDALTYNVGDGIGLEDMRYQIHIYRRL
ncbi:hypothetical protein LOZ57_002553 [Ophidiomyces ophidiicola]|uniref:uncharacterized protein n=1 Tax=Ophidiomyces ophidiicola TaxID=1387563 RepID=UPI0020C36DAE|nr:uncharacterized protein LOZ57_002553 [Ophidiomyces ophidiicola]KAI1949183.1 hypothetical protein LOZ57_002553 [Ophidiomyces ophidiicola]KAI2057293.1 hypothetical protein LOZ43_003212 [Ophidiomyces ophidiicola]